MAPTLAALQLDGDVLTVSWSNDDGHQEHWAEIDRVYPDDEGYYPVGAYLWPWRTTVV